jgi:hypothetical protein
MLLKDYIKYLQDNYSEDIQVISQIWLEDDVEAIIEERFEEYMPELKDKVPEIIEMIEKRMDANIGINWDFIADIIQLYFIDK